VSGQKSVDRKAAEEAQVFHKGLQSLSSVWSASWISEEVWSMPPVFQEVGSSRTNTRRQEGKLVSRRD